MHDGRDSGRFDGMAMQSCAGNGITGLRTMRRELLIQMSILPPGRKQLAVRPALDDATCVDDENAIRLEDGAQPMGHDERRAASEEFLQRLLHDLRVLAKQCLDHRDFLLVLYHSYL